jgi:hypothetical protein
MKIPNIKFYVYPFGRSRADTCGQKDEPKDTDGRTEMKKVIGVFHDFVKPLRRHHQLDPTSMKASDGSKKIYQFNKSK